MKRGKQPAKKSQAPFLIAIAVIAVIGIGVLTWLTTSRSGVGVTQVDPSLPAVQSEGYVMGSPSAPLEVIEFADFECPACERFATLTEPDVRERLIRTGLIRYRFIDFPLSMHRNAWSASRAAVCANEQGRFWEMHDAIFQTQDQWNTQATNRPERHMRQLAERLGLNTDQFDECIGKPETQAKVQAHLRLAEQRGVQATPTFIIGDRMVANALGYDQFRQLVNDAYAARGLTPGQSVAPAGQTPGTQQTQPSQQPAPGVAPPRP